MLKRLKLGISLVGFRISNIKCGLSSQNNAVLLLADAVLVQTPITTKVRPIPTLGVHVIGVAHTDNARSFWAVCTGGTTQDSQSCAPVS